MPGPSNLEQYLLELTNDARLDPLGDAARYITGYSPLSSPIPEIQSAFSFFHVNGSALLTAFQALSPQQPLAWSESLAAAARTHDNAMIASDTQAHVLPGESDIPTRVVAAGYSSNWSTLAENIYAYAISAFHAQAGFMVDWGNDTDGMQNPPGHRNNIMSSSVREVGIGIVPESNNNTDVGPLVVTEDFGNRFGLGPLLLGVAYTDSDHDGFYTPGEGLATLAVKVGITTVTSFSSGGYTLETTSGSKTVTLTGAGLSGPVTAAISLGATSNVKLDIVNGDTLHTSTSALVAGPVSTIAGLGLAGLTLSTSGDTLAHTIVGTPGSDSITGGNGDDTLRGRGGNDAFEGGSGVDTAIFSGSRAGYTITGDLANSVVSGPDGTDTLHHVEKFVFDDAVINVTSTLLSANPLSGRIDFNNDGKSDVLWQNNNGQGALWLTNGAAVTGNPYAGMNPGPTWHVMAVGDLNNDGKSDVVWQNDNGAANVWLMDGSTPIAQSYVGTNPGPSLHVKGAGDFNGDGKADILWQDDNGAASIWLMNGINVVGTGSVGPNPGVNWHIKGTGDFNGDGKSDILWQNDNGADNIWLMNGLNPIGQGYVGPNPGPAWHIKGTGDFNGDGKADILWQHDNGAANIWLIDGLNAVGMGYVGTNPGLTWHISDAQDFDGNGKSDILWQNDAGQPSVWYMNGISVDHTSSLGSFPGTGWHLIGSDWL